MYLLLGLLSFWGCEEKAQEAPDITITPTESCGGAPPVITELSCENTGMQFYPDANADLPTFTVRALVTDEDADLTSYTMIIKFDDVIDNALDESAEELTISGSMGSDACSVDDGNIGASIYLQGGPPDYSTEYEWYVSVLDAAGERSETEMIVCTTPDADGNGAPY